MSWAGHGSRLRSPIVHREKKEKGGDHGTTLRDIMLLYYSDDVINHKPCTLLKYTTQSLPVNFFSLVSAASIHAYTLEPVFENYFVSVICLCVGLA